MEILKLWNSWRTRTNGALNSAAEAIGRVWKNAETTGRMPSEADKPTAAGAGALLCYPAYVAWVP